jgi:hypothetical protein
MSRILPLSLQVGANPISAETTLSAKGYRGEWRTKAAPAEEHKTIAASSILSASAVLFGRTLRWLFLDHKCQNPAKRRGAKNFSGNNPAVVFVSLHSVRICAF